MAVRSLTLLVLLALSGCQPTRPSAPDELEGDVRAADLAGTRWIATHVEGAPVLPGTEPTLEIESHRAVAFGGCNGFGGRFHPARAFGLDDPIITVAGCAAAREAQEDRYFQAFVDIDRARIDGDRLVLLDATGRERVRLVRRPPPPGPSGPLAGSRWRLDRLDGRPVPAGTRGWLEFVNARTYRMREGCRRTQGHYVVTDERFHLTWQGADESACGDPEASVADQRRMSVLQHVVQHGLAGGRLHVIGRNGRRAVFEPCRDCAVDPLP